MATLYEADNYMNLVYKETGLKDMGESQGPQICKAVEVMASGESI